MTFQAICNLASTQIGPATKSTNILAAAHREMAESFSVTDRFGT
jgi:hypothetical protein